MATTGERIQAARLKAGLTQGVLAERAGVSARSLQGWEIGRREPNLAAAMAIAKALGVTVEQLMTGPVAEMTDTKPRPGRPKTRKGGDQ